MGKIKNVAVIDDRPFESLSKEERDAKWMRIYGKPYTPPTEKEKQDVLKKFGLK